MNYTNPNKQNLNEDRAAALMKGGSGIGGKIVACVLSLVIGIATPIAAIAGAGAWATSQPTATVFDTINGIVGTDFKYTDFLNESYGDKTVLTLLGDVFSAATELASETATLEKFANISPKVGESVSTISNLLEEEIGLVITEEELITTPFSTMIDFFKTRFNNSPAGDILTKFGATSPLIMALCYGEEGVDYIIDENNEVQMLGDSKKTLISDLMGDDISYLLDKVPLGAMLTDLDPNNSKDDMMFALAYGTKDTTYKVIPDDSEKGWHIEMQQVFYHSDDEILFEDYEHEEVDAAITEITGLSGGYRFEFTHTDEDTGTTTTEIQYVVYDSVSGTYLAYETLNTETNEVSDPILYKQTMVSTLTDDANVLLGHLYLKDILDIKDKDDNEVMLNLCYGVKGQDYDFNSAGEVVMLNGALPHTIGYLKKHKNDLIDSIHLADVLKPDFDSGIIMYMLYGTEGLHYDVEGEKVGDEDNRKVKQRDAFVYIKDGVVQNERGYALDTEDYDLVADGSGYKYTHNEHTYNLVLDESYVPAVDDVKEKYFLYLGENQVKFEPTRLGDLTGEHNPLSDFQENLALSDILPESDLDANPIFKNLKDTKIADIPTATQNLTIRDIFSEEIDPDSDGIPSGTWKYLLYNKENDGNGDKADETDYDWDLKILDDITALTTNMTKNMQSATLRELKYDEIITGLDDDFLAQPIKTSITVKNVGSKNIAGLDGISGKANVGALTVSEMFTYLSCIFDAFTALENGDFS